MVYITGGSGRTGPHSPSTTAGADPGFRRGGFVHSEGGVSYRNFRSGSKLLQGPGQINKQKLQTAIGGVSDDPRNPPVSAHATDMLGKEILACWTPEYSIHPCLKVHNVFPQVTFPPWLHPVKIWLHTVSG